MESDKRRFSLDDEDMDSVTFEPFTPTNEDIAEAELVSRKVIEDFRAEVIRADRKRLKLDE